LRLGADGIVMGSILDLKTGSADYHGYTRLKTTTYSAVLRVHLIDLTKDRKTKSIAAAIAASSIVSGSCVFQETPYATAAASDPYFSAIRDALDKLNSDKLLRAKMTGRVPKDAEATLTMESVSVSFSIIPQTATVLMKTASGWRYLGTSPCVKELPVGE